MDRRAGSAELLPLFAPYRIDAELTELDSADFMFTGNGPSGTVHVGIERKTLRDMLQCINTGRFAGEGAQLDTLQQTYGYAYLVIESSHRCDPATGILQEWRGRQHGWQDLRLGSRRYMASELQRYLIMMTLTQVRVWQTRDEEGTVRFIADLYQQLARKTWDEHRSTNQVYVPSIQEPVLLRKRTAAEENTLLRRTVALCLPGVGQDRSKAVAAYFPSVRDMANADAKQWQQVDGVGKKTAENVVKEITNAGI